MIKKLLSFMCCLVPFGASAVEYAPGNGAAVGGNGQTYVLTATGDENIVIKNGVGVVISKDPELDPPSSGGLTVENNMYIGQNDTGSVGGDFFAESAVNKTFTLQSDGNISVGGLLTVVDGYTFGINTRTTGTTINATLGDINAYGALSVESIDAFKSNTIDAANGLSIAANTITTDSIDVTGGNTILRSEGALTMTQFQTSGGNTTINAGSVLSGNIQNNGGAMNITVAGNLRAKDNTVISSNVNNIGSIENSGTSMSITAADVTVDGTMKNDSSHGSMTLNVANLTVNGGNETNRSFVNAGDLYMTVAGETNLAYGFDLSAMGADNSFSLDTGTLVFGSTASADAWLQVFAKDLKSFKLKIRQGDVTAGAIINGSATNTVANMEVSGKSVTADSVANNGRKLEIRGTDAAGNVKINGGVAGNVAASSTTIIAAGGLQVDGNVSNSGQMVLNGNTVNLSSVSNTGSKMEISSLTDATGSILISSDVANAGDSLTINARQIQIDGTVRITAGNASVRGSDANSGAYVKLGGVDVQGGSLKMDALIGGIDIANGLSVTGGALNIGQSTNRVTVDKDVLIGGNVSLGATDVAGRGNVNIAASGTDGFVLTSSTGGISIDGNIVATGTGTASRSAQFTAKTIEVGSDDATGGGDVAISNGNNKIIFGASDKNQSLKIHGAVSVNNGGALELWTDDSKVGSLAGNGLFIVHGSQVTAQNGAIEISGNMWFDGTSAVDSGLVVVDTNTFTLKSNTAGVAVNNGGAVVATDKTLNMIAATDATIGGTLGNSGTVNITATGGTAGVTGATTNSGVLNVHGNSVNMGAITNTNTLDVVASGNATIGSIQNSAQATVSGYSVSAGAIASTAGVLDVDATTLRATSVNVSGGTLNLDVAQANVTNAVTVNGGDLYQGTTGKGMLNIAGNNSTISAKSLSVSGDLVADVNSVTYTLSDIATIDGDIKIAKNATVDLSAKTLTVGKDVVNNGTLALTAQNGMTIGDVITYGNLTLDSGTGIAAVQNLTVTDGTLVLAGAGLTATANGNKGNVDVSGVLYQNYTGTLEQNDVNIVSDNYVLTAGNLELDGIVQLSRTTNSPVALTLNTSDLIVHGDIDAKNMRVAANPSSNWLNVQVDGSVLGGAQFIGLEMMNISGNYVFDNASQINAAILKYADGVQMNSAFPNYWSTVSLNDDNTFGVIKNADDGGAMIQVGGTFASVADLLDGKNWQYISNSVNGGALAKPQIGLVLRDIVDQGTAIWLLHADGEIADDNILSKIQDLNISFCNADGSICYNYLDSFNLYNNTTDELPAYISTRDTNGNGVADSLYVVFDPRFGGPMEIFKIQPIVNRVDNHTKGEYKSAGALDAMIEGKVQKSGFYNRTPIEVIPILFKNTNMAQAAQELYDRMAYYSMNRDGTALARFSRLFQVREAEQIVSDIVLNEHTNFRSFEDRMFDEFIWNRNRNLKKAWMDIDYGMFTHNARDNKHVGGHRFNVSGGFDWQESQTLILGLTGRLSYMASHNSDSMDLGYLPNQHIAGNVDVRVSDTDVGLGAYLMKILGQETRLYGNGFLDIHFLDVDRHQNFVSNIDGNGAAFSLMSEWGLLHDWMNQYLVGNMYARVGYNTGFSVTEKASGDDYMKLKSDGYLTFTPGYSLMVQKRIYPSAWWQVRPYASIGVEYDILGAPDDVKYKFASANRFTSYDVNVEPLWANIGGGIEVLSAMGIQVGVDYRYQYNPEIQLHNIRVSGSYRF